MRFIATLALLLCLCFCPCRGADAATRVRVLATDPPGDAVILARDQNFYLLLEYETDRPVGIWARPYFQGREVAAGSNPSASRSGTGRTIGWFFFMHPGDEVDEIRIRAGDGSTGGTTVVATYPVRITAGAEPAAARAEPDWVAQLNRRDREEQRAAYQARMSTPPSTGEVALFNGFMLLMLAIGLAGFAAPAFALYRWRGGWRLLAAVPAAGMAFVLLRLLIDTARDPTSHNLWPFEILIAGGLGSAAMFVLFALRRAMRAR
jgi:hypothetical protein